MVEISNREELEAWLEGQPREVCVAIAARAALRSLPFLSRVIWKLPEDRDLEDDLTIWLRALATQMAFVTSPHQRLESAVLVAGNRFAIDEIPDSGARSAITAISAGRAAIAASEVSRHPKVAVAMNTTRGVEHAARVFSNEVVTFWDATSADATWIKTHGYELLAGLMGEPIWPDGVPLALRKEETALLDYLEASDNVTFWGRWYAHSRVGNPMNWEMQKEIALIPDKDWRQGAIHVARLIAEIEEKYAPQLDPETVRDAAARLQRSPITTAHMSTHAKADIEAKITEFLACCGNPNCLPEELRPLEALPAIFARFGELAGHVDAKDAQIEAYKRTIEALHAKVAELEQNLAAAREGVFSEEFKKSLAKSILDPVWYRGWGINLAALGGAAVFGYSYFNSPAVSHETVEHIFECIQEIRAIDPEKMKSFDLPQIGVDPGSSPG